MRVKVRILVSSLRRKIYANLPIIDARHEAIMLVPVIGTWGDDLYEVGFIMEDAIEEELTNEA